MIAAILLTASSFAPQWHLDGSFPEPDAVLAEVSNCGVNGAEVFREGSVVVLPPDLSLSDPQLDCIAHASFDTGYYFVVPANYTVSYHQRNEEIASPWNREIARHKLAELGKLADLPIRRIGVADTVFATEIARYCNADGALSSGFGPHVIGPDWLAEKLPESALAGSAMMCLLSAATISDFEIGFIGNDKIAEEEVVEPTG